MKHIVALSGGKDSTALALRLREIEPETPFEYVCTPTGDELPDMLAHWDRLGQLLQSPIKKLYSPLGDLHALIDDWNALPNWRQRWCTRVLKIEVFETYYRQVAPGIAYVGLRADEEARQGMVFSGDIEQRYPLREWGWGLDSVLGYLKDREVKIPKRTDCARCPYQRLGEWRALWLEHPRIYQSAIDQEKSTGHTFRSPGRDTWPAPLDELAAEFKAGRTMRGGWETDDEGACRVCSL